MEPAQVLTLGLGAFFGALGWLVVGLFISRRQYERQAKNAARAVYFELDVDRINVVLARDHGVFQGLVRSSFDRLLPELATWLSAAELRTVTKAYMSHAGYEQVRTEASIPEPVRTAVLARTAEAHDAALEILSRRAFSEREIADMQAADQGGTETPPRRRATMPRPSR
jgi:hypothetical protein